MLVNQRGAVAAAESHSRFLVGFVVSDYEQSFMRRLLVAKFSGELDLTGRSLENIPANVTVMPLQSLKRLMLDHNAFTALPKILFKMVNLEMLRMQYNRLGTHCILVCAERLGASGTKTLCVLCVRTVV